MPWIRLDDQFPDHPKTVAAGPQAAWLFVCGIGYCNRLLTDGVIPTGQVRKLADVDNAMDLAAKLVEVGLWEAIEGGYRIHDFLEYQPSAEQVKAERLGNAQRQQEWRDRQRDKGRNGVTNTVTASVSNAPRNGPVTPPPYPTPSPFPIPTKPTQNEETPPTPKPKAKPKPVLLERSEEEAQVLSMLFRVEGFPADGGDDTTERLRELAADFADVPLLDVAKELRLKAGGVKNGWLTYRNWLEQKRKRLAESPPVRATHTTGRAPGRPTTDPGDSLAYLKQRRGAG